MPLFSPSQVARELAVSVSTVTRMIQRGQMPAILLSAGRRKKTYRVRPEVLDRWLKSREVKPRRGARVNGDESVSEIEPGGKVAPPEKTIEVETEG